MNYQVSSEVQRLVEKTMATGQYRSTNDVFLEALRTLHSQNEELAEIQTGLDELTLGQYRPMAEVAEEIRVRLGLCDVEE